MCIDVTYNVVYKSIRQVDSILPESLDSETELFIKSAIQFSITNGENSLHCIISAAIPTDQNKITIEA